MSMPPLPLDDNLEEQIEALLAADTPAEVGNPFAN